MAAEIAIVGAGYVGMPLARAFAEAGKNGVLVDIDRDVVAGINRGPSHSGAAPSPPRPPRAGAGRLSAGDSYDVVKDAGSILIALPTPLSSQREPDLSIVKGAAEEIAQRLRAGPLVRRESTPHPGTTRECLQPILERSGLRAGHDFHLAFS